jgi:two-component system, NtrC family, sensor kinase
MVDLHKVISETLTLIEHQLAQAQVKVQVSLNAEVPRVKGNPGKLQQVFLNLFLNARDAMESGGTLAIRTARGPDHVLRVTVADSGAGIAAENLTRIFDPFFTTQAAKKGTGLGLSVSYGIIKEHGGDIEVESEPGAGTRFELWFPEAAPAPQGTGARAVEPPLVAPPLVAPALFLPVAVPAPAPVASVASAAAIAPAAAAPSVT